MLELGPITDAAHREMGAAVAASGAAEFVGLGRARRLAVEAAREAGLAESHHAATFEDTVALLLKRLAPGDAVLVKGSRGMRMERVVDALARPLRRRGCLMLYELLVPLARDSIVFNVFRYITFRAAMATVTAHADLVPARPVDDRAAARAAAWRGDDPRGHARSVTAPRRARPPWAAS